jgi:uncharacterized phage-like protein YoqJ
MLILGATGHRLHLLPGYQGSGSSQKLRTALLETAMDALAEWHPDEVISGVATGWDMAVAAAAMLLNVPYRCYVPFIGQEKLWSEADKTMYNSLLDQADEVRVISPVQHNGAYLERDQAMVDDSGRMIALCFGDRYPDSGTAYTLAYADGWLVPWTNYAEAFLERMGIHE